MRSGKKKSVLAALVGIVGLITIIGLSDLMFILPNATDRQATPTPTPAPSYASTSTSQDVTIPFNLKVE
ncbi:MAG: hypothetical protein KBC26_02650 [Candidatus Pacebacteria bacterium]|nr:hypothetical protein [Candidatus Paceibacterota bacterium]